MNKGNRNGILKGEFLCLLNMDKGTDGGSPWITAAHTYPPGTSIHLNLFLYRADSQKRPCIRILTRPYKKSFLMDCFLVYPHSDVIHNKDLLFMVSWALVTAVSVVIYEGFFGCLFKP
jgi:hypothetical protein